jgi:hypothetical protein
MLQALASMKIGTIGENELKKGWHGDPT